MKNSLLLLSQKYNGNWDQIYDFIGKILVEKTKDIPISKFHPKQFISITDEKYPSKLKLIKNPPLVIYYKGNIDILNNKNINIWLNSSYLDVKYKSAIDTIIEELNSNKYNFNIIIGTTTKLDSYVISRSKLANVIVVKEAGINSNLVITKEIENKLVNNKCLIISQFPGNTIYNVDNTEKSNMIKVTLSDTLAFINTKPEKKTFELIIKAIEFGKSIYCYKNYEDNLSQNFKLIENGAFSFIKISDILNF